MFFEGHLFIANVYPFILVFSNPVVKIGY